MNAEQKQGQFEAWMRREFPRANLNKGVGYYRDPEINERWLTWQAALRSTPAAPQLPAAPASAEINEAFKWFEGSTRNPESDKLLPALDHKYGLILAAALRAHQAPQAAPQQAARTFGHDDLPLLDTPEKIKEWCEQPVAPQPPQCPNCEGEGSTTRSVVEQRFNWTAAHTSIPVVAKVPVYTCAKCREQFTDIEGELAQTEAILQAVAKAFGEVVESQDRILAEQPADQAERAASPCPVPPQPAQQEPNQNNVYSSHALPDRGDAGALPVGVVANIKVNAGATVVGIGWYGQELPAGTKLYAAAPEQPKVGYDDGHDDFPEHSATCPACGGIGSDCTCSRDEQPVAPQHGGRPMTMRECMEAEEAQPANQGGPEMTNDRRVGPRPYTHFVEGTVDGVPLTNYFKRPDKAEKAAKATGGILYDITATNARRWNVEQQTWEKVL